MSNEDLIPCWKLITNNEGIEMKKIAYLLHFFHSTIKSYMLLQALSFTFELWPISKYEVNIHMQLRYN
jgi:hypothetical protein